MIPGQRKKRVKKIVAYVAAPILALFLLFLLFVDNLVEPILRERIHTLIIRGSDSLYNYRLGNLKANFFGGNVEVEDLEINIDSNRYHYLKERKALPSLTMQLRLDRGQIRGISVVSLLLGKKVRVNEILSREADIRLSRHVREDESIEPDQPLWKSIRPDIEGIYVGRIRLDGIKLLYRNADTAESVKLQFDRCDALFEDIAVDSSSMHDTSRIGFTRNIFMKFNDLKFRSFDSTYKLKAEWITYSSRDRTLQIDSFKLQPTLEEEEFYKAYNVQKSLFHIEFVKVRLTNLKLERYLHSNLIEADSVIFNTPKIHIYNDRSADPDFESKIGRYPHQKLLNANEKINVKHIAFSDGEVRYREKNAKTLKVGELFFDQLSLKASNITNDPRLIKKNPVCTASVGGRILGAGQVHVDFRFFLDSLEGQYEARGSVKNISAAHLNPLALSFANVDINSFSLHQLDFVVRGEDFEASSDVEMPYNNLAITIRKTDEETGITKTNKFMTRVLNKFVIWPDNPANGVTRVARGARVSRLTSQSFFSLFWKAIFAGMQNIMMRSGRYS